MIEYVAAGISTVVAPVVGWLISKVIDNDRRIAVQEAAMDAHEKSDTIRFTGIEDLMNDLKEGQRDQSQKMDRLIEGNLRDATQANITHANELRVAAASAMVIVERAKDSALAVVAEAARVAKSINPLT